MPRRVFAVTELPALRRAIEESELLIAAMEHELAVLRGAGVKVASLRPEFEEERATLRDLQRQLKAHQSRLRREVGPGVTDVI